MTPEIWSDLLIRLKNLRGDMIGQWVGDSDNDHIGTTIHQLSTTIRAWNLAKPVVSTPPEPIP